MRNIQDIIENDLCIGCGACVYACNQKKLKIEFNEYKGMYEPKFTGDSHCDECNCIKVCPSYKVDYNELSEFLFKTKPDTSIGHVEGVYLVQSKNRERNINASSGGIIKETLKYYFDEGLLDSVIALKHIKGIEYRPALINDVNDIDNLPGSIYHNIDFSKAMSLLQKAEGKVALVAIPCQLDGIIQYIKLYDQILLDKIVLTIGLICGWTFTHHAIKAICNYTNVPYDSLTNISFRGGGPIGKLKLFKNDGTVVKVNRRVNLKYQAAFDRSYNLKRCHFCVNHGNFLSDLVVGDAWLPSTVMTRTGISIVIARRLNEVRTLEKMYDKGLITLLKVTENDIIESQTKRVVFGDFSYPYADYIKSLGELSPTFIGPNKVDSNPVSQEELAYYNVLNNKKIKLQREGKFKLLFFLKYTREGKSFLMRYINWFLVRILRIKSLSGKRKEVSLAEMKNFN